MSVQNSIFIGEVFQIKVSDGLVHLLWSRKIGNSCPPRVFTGAQVLQLRSLYMLRMSILIPMHVQNIIFIGEVFQIKVSDGLVHSLKLGSCQKVNLYPGCLRGHEFSGFFMSLEFQTIMPKSVYNDIFIGEVFQIEVSDGLNHPLGSQQNVNLCPARVFTGARLFLVL